MAERSDAEVYCHVGADKAYVCPDDVKNIDPNGVGRGRAVGMRRKEAMTGFKMSKGESVDFTGFDPDLDEEEKADVDEWEKTGALLGHFISPTGVDGNLGDIRQTVFAVDSTTLSIAEALNGTGEFDFDGIHTSDFALASNRDLQVGEMDSVPNIRGAAEDAIAHLGLEDLGQQIFLNHAETVRGDRSTTDESVSQAFDRLLNEPDGLVSLKETMGGLVPLNTSKKQKSYPGTNSAVEVSA